MTLHPLAQRLLATGSRQPYRLERVLIRSVDDGLEWMRDWAVGGGRYIWMGASDAERRRAIRHWRWLRHLHQQEIRERGGAQWQTV